MTGIVLAVFLLLFLLALLFSRPFRLSAAFALVALVIAICWDDFATEVVVPANRIESLGSRTFIFAEKSSSPVVKLELEAANNGSIELESIEVLVTLADCIGSHPCEPVGRQSERIQLFADPGQAKRAEAMLYFTNIPKLNGTLTANARITGGIGDR